MLFWMLYGFFCFLLAVFLSFTVEFFPDDGYEEENDRTLAQGGIFLGIAVFAPIVVTIIIVALIGQLIILGKNKLKSKTNNEKDNN